MPNAIKKCVDCGDPFETSRTGKTVRCTSCRRKRHFASSTPSGTAYRESYFTCDTCGKRMTRGEAFKHRRDTGHTKFT